MEDDLEARVLKCKACGHRFHITSTMSGVSIIRPGQWFSVGRVDWTAKCTCRTVRRDNEWDLYRAIGYGGSL